MPTISLNGTPLREARLRMRRVIEATNKVERDFELTKHTAKMERERIREKVRGTMALREAILAAITKMRAPALKKLRSLRSREDGSTDKKSDPWTLADYLELANEFDATALQDALAAEMAGQFEFGLTHAHAELGTAFDVPPDAALAALDKQALDFSVSVSDDEAAALKAMIRQSFEDGIGANDLASQIADFFDAGVHRQLGDESGIFREIPVDAWAEQVARTEVARAQNAGIIETYNGVGIDEVMWLAADDERTCPVCSDLDGETAKLGEPFDLSENGVTQPPEHPSCRCTVVATSTDSGDAPQADEGDTGE